MALNDFVRLHGFRMSRQKRRHFLRVGFACLRVRLRCNQPVIKGLWGVNRKYRRVDHSRAPFFTVGQLKQNSETTDYFGGISDVGVAASQREAADDWRTSSFEDYGF